MSMAPETIKDLTNAGGEGCRLGHHLEPCWYPRATLLQETCLSEWPALPPGTIVSAARTLPGSMVLSQPRSVGHVATKDHIDAWEGRGPGPQPVARRASKGCVVTRDILI